MEQTVKRAKHTVQLLRFNGDIMVPKNDGSDETEDIENWQQLDNSLEIMCLEYMKNGDMFRFLARIGCFGTHVPNQVLWKIFICRKCAIHARVSIPLAIQTQRGHSRCEQSSKPVSQWHTHLDMQRTQTQAKTGGLSLKGQKTRKS